MLADLKTLFEAPKTFPVRPYWIKRDEERFNLVSPLDIGGVTIEGLQFRAIAMINRTDEMVTFQLEYFPAKKNPKGGPIARIEWKPLAAHSNKNIGPEKYRNLIQKGSHHHEFALNWQHDSDGVRKGNKSNLPISVPIKPEPTFDEMLAFVGKEFNISPIEWVSRPPWEPKFI